MYDLPSQSEIKKFTITKLMVEETTKGKILPIYCTDRQQETA